MKPFKRASSRRATFNIYLSTSRACSSMSHDERNTIAIAKTSLNSNSVSLKPNKRAQAQYYTPARETHSSIKGSILDM